jgi:hypothetical protein
MRTSIGSRHLLLVLRAVEGGVSKGEDAVNSFQRTARANLAKG